MDNIPSVRQDIPLLALPPSQLPATDLCLKPDKSTHIPLFYLLNTRLTLSLSPLTFSTLTLSGWALNLIKFRRCYYTLFHEHIVYKFKITSVHKQAYLPSCFSYSHRDKKAFCSVHVVTGKVTMTFGQKPVCFHYYNSIAFRRTKHNATCQKLEGADENRNISRYVVILCHVMQCVCFRLHFALTPYLKENAPNLLYSVKSQLHRTRLTLILLM
jgi:hypothetical protein